MKKAIQRFFEQKFLFEELVKRDFKKKYTGTILGVGWSMLSPLLSLLVMKLVFTQFFGRNTPHYTIYLFIGNVIFTYYSDATKTGLKSLVMNAPIFTKINMPKYLFVFSANAQTFLNFLLTLIILFIFVAFDSLKFTWKYLFLIYPIIMLLLFNIGVSMILSAFAVFFRDMTYIYEVFVKLLSYLSAVFYSINTFPEKIQNLFLLNPVYLFIRYFRKIIIEDTVPHPYFHLLMLADTVIVLFIGFRIYRKNNMKFLYYV